MKVKQVIKLLEATYEPDDELMIDWVDRFVFDDVDEVSKEVWSDAVGTVEGAYASMIDMDYVQDVVNEATEEAYQRSR